MHLVRTEKARQELRPGVRTLTQKQRSVLLLADGRKSLLDLRGLFDGEAEILALELLREGYLAVGGAAGAARPAATPSTTPASTQASMTSTGAFRVNGTGSAPAVPAPVAALAAVAAVAADSFEGKRSLATTRMFLFDLCERMFARRDPALAERFRAELRVAKDRDSMLNAGRAMIEEIERVAGHERADSIAQRIAMLLPPEEYPA